MKTSPYKNNGACPIVIQYSTVQSYLDDTLDFLLEDIVKNNIILGQCLNFGDKEISLDSVLLINYFLENKLVLTGFRNMEKMILVGKDYTQNDICQFSTYFKEDAIELKGVLGAKDLVSQFSDLFSQNSTIEKELIAHELVKLNEIELSEGSFELANEADIDLIADWLILFQEECDLDHKVSLERAKQDCASFIAKNRMYKWVVNGKIVSICAENARTEYYSKISLVYTPHNHRKKNYARSCVYSLANKLKNQGQKICLFTDKSNPTSNKIYAEIGFEAVNEDYLISFY